MNPLPPTISPFAGFSEPAELISLEQAVGRVSTRVLMSFPPCRCEILPGAYFTERKVRELQRLIKEGVEIDGLEENGALVEVSSLSHQHNNFHIEVLETQNVTKELSDEIADNFRAFFAVEPYCHFAFSLTNPNLSLAPWELPSSIKLPRKPYYSPRELEAVPLESLDLRAWVEVERCRSLIWDRFQDPGYLAIARDKTTKKLVGLLHARIGSLKRIYESEEWQNPRLFSNVPFEPNEEKDQQFYRRMNFYFDFKPETKLCTISAQYIAPEVRNGRVYFELMRQMAFAVKPSDALLPLVSELPPEGSAAHVLNKVTTDRFLYDVLPNGHGLAMSAKTSNSLVFFTIDRHFLTGIVKQEIATQRALFVPHPSDNENLEIRKTPKGWGVFATAEIKKGETIAAFRGEVYLSSKASELPAIMVNHAIQTGPETFVHGHKCLAELLNHSCEPNVGLRGLTELVAAEDIKENEECVWDYRLSEDSDWVLHQCCCETKSCTGSVAGFSSLPLKKQKEYFSRNLVSDWIRLKHMARIRDL